MGGEGLQLSRFFLDKQVLHLIAFNDNGSAHGRGLITIEEINKEISRLRTVMTRCIQATIIMDTRVFGLRPACGKDTYTQSAFSSRPSSSSSTSSK